VIFEVFVWLGAHINIKPNNFAIICAQNEVVASWMDINAGDPLTARLIFGHDLLLLKIILKDLHMCARKEMWLRRVE